jgi:phosphoserine aminotransferase
MRKRPVNFSAGPGILPLSVLEEASQGVIALEGIGLSILEISHRSKTFDAIIESAKERLRRVLRIPESYEVLFLQGGAQGQFAQFPYNFLKPGAVGSYVVTGMWSQKAIEAAAALGNTHVLASSESVGFRSLPDLSGVQVPPDTAYVHTTSNNTIYGTQWHSLPDFSGHRHVCDISSDILSSPLDVDKFAMLYAGAQKNAGPAGVTIVIIRRDWLEEARTDIPKIWQYAVQASKGSMLNTPPTFSIYVVSLMLKWLEAQGGVDAIMKINQAKADLIYGTCAESDGFYVPVVSEPSQRSRMNVTWTMSTPEEEKRFVSAAEEAGLSGLKGHRILGGLRASIYNAMPMEGVERLVEFMRRFARHGG